MLNDNSIGRFNELNLWILSIIQIKFIVQGQYFNGKDLLFIEKSVITSYYISITRNLFWFL